MNFLKKNKMLVLIEMRPALDGYAGIPQETRLLFRGLSMIDAVEIQGLLQTSLRFLSSGIKFKKRIFLSCSDKAKLKIHSKVINTLQNNQTKRKSESKFKNILIYLRRRLVTNWLAISTLITPWLQQIKTSTFESIYFKKEVWELLFSKTLNSTDFESITTKSYKVCSIPWNVMQSVGLNSLKFQSKAVYPKLDTKGVDIFITQTPYPAKISDETIMIVRYHDALPILMPDLFPNKIRHHATHYHALLSNIKNGAYFACVSEATRQELLQLFPELYERTVTIHNLISPHFFEEPSKPELVRKIILSRLNLNKIEVQPKFIDDNDKKRFYQKHLGKQPLKYLLVVSTIEPRKNHVRLISALKIIHEEIDSSIKLVFVGNLGWDYDPIINNMQHAINNGNLFLLNNVPSEELRVLYKHASATVCPSIAEGFDFSGVESMNCGGIVLASNIPVHHEIYGNAAEYFDPNSTIALVNSVKNVFYESHSENKRNQLRANGKKIASQYKPEVILPQWESFLKKVSIKK